jgi:hypothetical protein
MNPPYNRQAALIIFIFLVLNAILLLSVNLLPFQDLPNHLAEATIFKSNFQGSHLSEYYRSVPWYFPNTFHPVFCSLFSDIETGNKIFYVLYASTLLLSVFLIIRELNGNPWYGLLSLIFIYNYNVTFGFSGFTISISALLFFFYILLLDARKSSWLYKFLASIMLVLLFLMHAQNALFGLALYGLFMLYRYWGKWKSIIVSAFTVPLPVILMVFLWWSKRATEKEESTFAFLGDYYKTKYLQSILLRLRLAVFDNFQLQPGMKGLALGAFFFILIFIPLFYFKAWRKNKHIVRWDNTQFMYPLIFLITAFACYLFLPNSLPGQSPLYERFSTIVNLSFLICGSVLLKNINSKFLKYYALAAAILYHALWFEYIYSFNVVNKEFNAALFDRTQGNDRLGGLIYDNKYRGRMLYLHFPSYYIVRKKGLATSMIIDYRFGVVRRTEKGEQIPVYNEWIGEVYKPEPAYKESLEYILVRGRSANADDPNLSSFYKVKQAGSWELFKNKNSIPPAQ